MSLHRAMEQSQQHEENALALFETWQQTWNKNRDLLAERLMLLNQQMDNLVPPSPANPLLTIVHQDDAIPEEVIVAGRTVEGAQSGPNPNEPSPLPMPKFLEARPKLRARHDPNAPG